MIDQKERTDSDYKHELELNPQESDLDDDMNEDEKLKINNELPVQKALH
jgi:hypothetical protein